MRVRAVGPLVVLGIAAMGVSIAGCAAPVHPDVPSSPSRAAVVATPSPVTTDAAVMDAESCEQFGDVLTILQNADADFADGRMQQQERDEWLWLATRVLHRIPTRGEGAVSDAIASLKMKEPEVAAGMRGSTDIDNPQSFRVAALDRACEAVGHRLMTLGFTGG